MSATSPEQNPSKRFSSFFNWTSLSGLVVVAASLFAFILLMTMDFFSDEESPYLGILTYLVAPGFFFLGVAIQLFGWWLHRRAVARGKREGIFKPTFTIDFSRAKDRRYLILFVCGAMVFLLVTSIGSYQTYHVTKSVVFCGEACHDIMEPQYVAFQHSPHAQVECTLCHIGPGAKSFMKAKFNGLHQVYVALFSEPDRPIKTHGNLDINEQTCTQCHWPKEYVGNLDKTYTHFLDEDENTPYSVRLSLKVGGGDPARGPVGGIHWHMNLANKIEYIATDEYRQVIPWVRWTDENGEVTVFKTDDFEGDPANFEIHTMNCMDCHNRPAHHFRAPNDAVDLAMSLGNISTNLPAVKRAAVLALTQEYETKEQALRQIEARFKEQYEDHPDVPGTVAAVQDIFRINFFPGMKTDFSQYPNNIGHKDWPGCFRCHDDQHKSPDGGMSIKANDCNACHTILAEGRTTQFETLSAVGLEYKHPEEGWEGFLCTDCHNGSLEEY